MVQPERTHHTEFIRALFSGVRLDGPEPFRRARHGLYADLFPIQNLASKQTFDGLLLIGREIRDIEFLTAG